MAIGLGAALIGSAIIGGGAAIASGNSSKKAINRATDAQTQATRESNALTRQIYDLNTRNLTPFMQRGNTAGGTINALAGLGTPEQTTAANNAFRTFIDNSDYAFQRGEMERGLGARLSALGGLESGAARKALQERGKALDAGYRGQYFDVLFGQQGVGLSGANALAGVGTNFANNVTNNNMANAHAIGQGAVARGAINANTIAGLGNIFGNALGQFGGFGSSFGSPNAYGIAGSGGIY